MKPDFHAHTACVVYNMSRPNPRPDTTHDHGQQLASMSGTAQPSHIALVSVVQEVSGNRAVSTEHVRTGTDMHMHM